MDTDTNFCQFQINVYYLDNVSENILNKFAQFFKEFVYLQLFQVYINSLVSTVKGGRQPHLVDVCVLRNPRSCWMIFCATRNVFSKIIYTLYNYDALTNNYVHNFVVSQIKSYIFI